MNIDKITNADELAVQVGNEVIRTEYALLKSALTQAIQDEASALRGYLQASATREKLTDQLGKMLPEMVKMDEKLRDVAEYGPMVKQVAAELAAIPAQPDRSLPKGIDNNAPQAAAS